MAACRETLFPALLLALCTTIAGAVQKAYNADNTHLPDDSDSMMLFSLQTETGACLYALGFRQSELNLQGIQNLYSSFTGLLAASFSRRWPTSSALMIHLPDECFQLPFMLILLRNPCSLLVWRSADPIQEE